MSNTKVICGLGNPGTQFTNTPHNSGFRVIDHLETALDKNFLFSEEGKEYQYTKYEYEGNTVYLIKTLFYYNLTGTVLGKFLNDMKLVINDNVDLLIVHDELDIDLGKIKVVASGSTGNSNGCKNIDEVLGLNGNWNRIKVGIKPDYKLTDKVNYVIGPLPLDKPHPLNVGELLALNAAMLWLSKGIMPAMNVFNTKVKEDVI